MLVKDTGEGQVSPRHLLVMSTEGPASVVQPCSWLMVLVLVLSGPYSTTLCWQLANCSDAHVYTKETVKGHNSGGTFPQSGQTFSSTSLDSTFLLVGR